jgi:hypothetical protein
MIGKINLRIVPKIAAVAALASLFAVAFPSPANAWSYTVTTKSNTPYGCRYQTTWYDGATAVPYSIYTYTTVLDC